MPDIAGVECFAFKPADVYELGQHNTTRASEATLDLLGNAWKLENTHMGVSYLLGNSLAAMWSGAENGTCARREHACAHQVRVFMPYICIFLWI